jgi:acyl transferase domain-containing protein
VVFPPPVFSDEDRAAQALRLTGTDWAQPALAAHSLSLLALLAAIGIEPDCVAGHSLGELVALHAAGAMDAESLLLLARRRGELMARIDGAPGAMLAVGADAAAVDKAIEATTATTATTRAARAQDPAGPAGLWPANFNAPRQTVVSGTEDLIEALRAQLSAEGITARRLEVSAAFHSPLVASVSEPLRRFLDGLELAAPRIDVYGNADARVYDRDAQAVRSRLVEHTEAPVRFQEQIEAMYAAGVRTFVEVGAGSALGGLIGQILGERAHVAVCLDKRGRDGVTAWHEGLARLAVGGVPMDLSGLSRNWISAPPRPKHSMDHRRMTVHVDGTGYRNESQQPVDGTTDSATPRLAPRPRPADTEPPLPSSSAYPLVANAEPRAPIDQSTAPHPSASFPLEPAPVMSDPRESAFSEPSAQWLAAVQEIQRQTAEAHMHFQTVLGDAHRSFLQTAENTFAAFASPPSTGYGVPPLAAPVAAAPPLAAPPIPIPNASADAVRAAEPLAPAPVLAVADAVPAAAPPAPEIPPPISAPEPEQDLDLELLLEVVADKTGYPIDMLDGGMDLEADLGIDSIKKVEIFAAVRQQAAGMPAADSPQMAQLFQLRTPDEVVRWAGSRNDVPSGRDESTSSAAQAHGVDRPEVVTEVMRRLQVRPLAAPACGLALAGLVHGPLIVVDGGSGLAQALVGQLASRGVAAVAADQPEPDAWGVILLGGMAAISGPQEAVSVNRAALQTAGIVAARMAERGGVFVTVQDTGGCFGLLDPDPARAWLGGLAGLARTAALEWPLAAVKAIDCRRGARDEHAVAAALVEELLTGGSTLDVGLRADGTRWTVTQDEAAVPPAAPAAAGADPVVVATGGARGVTAAAMIAWAAANRSRMLLIGRTALVDEPGSLAEARDEKELTGLLAAQARTAGEAAMPAPAQLAARARAIIAAREVRETLAELERSGATVRYAAFDITDRAALERELALVRRDWGPVTGIVHGAGVLADKRIADKTDEQFDRVYATKVEGLRALLEATASDPLDLICLFSSVAARYGNVGQSDYAMANEVLNQVACAEQARRPACRVRSIGWGPWAGGMVTASLAAHFVQRGVPLIPLDAGAHAFVAEAGAGDGAVQVLIGAGADPGAMAARPRIAAEVVVDASTHGYLADHAPAGVPVLPLAMAVEWFSAAGRARDPDQETALCDIHVLNRIDLPDLKGEGHRFTIEGRPADRAPGALDLRLMSPTGIAHYRARLVAPDGPPGSWGALSTGSGGYVEPVYDSPALFHGPGFQTLRHLDRVSQDGADARVVGLREVGWPGDHWWTDPAALDGALQTAVLWALHATGEATLPMGVDLLRVHRTGPAPGPLRALVRAGTVGGDQMRCDVALLDEDGRPRAELFGVSLIRRPDLTSALGAGSVATA